MPQATSLGCTSTLVIFRRLSSVFPRSIRVSLSNIAQQNGRFVLSLCRRLRNMQACDNSSGLGLIRALGLWSAIAVIVGSMVGQAVFLVASDMARELERSLCIAASRKLSSRHFRRLV